MSYHNISASNLQPLFFETGRGFPITHMQPSKISSWWGKCLGLLRHRPICAKASILYFAPMYPADTGHIVVLHHSSAVIPSFLCAASRQYSHCLLVLILPLYQNPAGMDTVPFKTRTVLMLISPYKDSSCFFEKTFLLLSSSRFHRSRRTMFQTAAAVETVLLLYLEWLSR